MSSEMKRVFLRPARESDLPAVMELERFGFDSGIQEDESVFASRLRLFPAGFLLLIDGADQSVAGYYCAERWPAVPVPTEEAYALGGDPSARCAADGRVLYTASMTVGPAHRGRGTGAFLFREARARVLASHPSLAAELLIVRASWSAARRVYAAEGFSETAALPGFFSSEDGGQGIVMEKERRS